MEYANPKFIVVSGLLFFLVACQKDTGNSKPVALFEVAATQAGVYEVITFTNQSENATSYVWDFGDGTTSTKLNPSHSYESAGEFTVELTARNEDLMGSTTKQMKIVVPENIVPGVGIMGIELGETWQTAADKLPSDFEVFDFLTITVDETTYYIHPVGTESRGLLMFLLSIGSSESIGINDVVFLFSAYENFIGKTEENIVMGSTDIQVENAYGTPTEIDYDYNGFVYSNYGIDFYFDEFSKTIEMDIYLADAKKSATIQRQLREELRKLRP